MNDANSKVIERILIIGQGSIGKRHLKIARELLPNADIHILRRKHGITIPDGANGCFTSLEQAIAFSPQMAVIASPSTLHVSQALVLAVEGVHLLVEKPLSISQEGITQLLEACRKKDVCLLTGYNLRFVPSLQKFRDMLSENVIGRVYSVRCEVGQYLPTWRPDSDYRQGVSARKELGGGVLLELSHELDYLRWIFGEFEWVQAVLSRQSELKIDVEDTVHLTMGFVPNNTGDQLVGSVNMDFIRHDTTRICTAIGKNGSLRWNGVTGVVEQIDEGEKEWREVFQHRHKRDDSYLAEWQHFLNCIMEKETPLITGEDGLSVLQIIEAARQASDTERRIEVVAQQ